MKTAQTEWEILEKMSEETNGSGIFLTLKDGDEVMGVFRGQPKTFYSIFTDKTHKEYDTRVEGSSFRFKVNVVIKNALDEFEAKIWTAGSKVRDALLAVRQEYGLDVMYKIKRTGSGKDDTVYSILFKKNLSKDELAEVEKIALQPLEKQKKDGKGSFAELESGVAM